MQEANTQECQEHQQLKEKVKNMLVEAPHISSQKLDLINEIQRLGVSYQFEKEIEATLQLIFRSYYESNIQEDDENDLYIVSLRFRLLRQHGYPVPCRVFEKFTGFDGKFKESDNVQAIINLYEASHLRVHGENILDEALIFSTSYLQSMQPNLTNHLKSQVNEALKRPIWKRLTRIEAKRYISIYEFDESHDVVLLKFAKLDFNMLQKEHQWEIGCLTRWDASAINELPEYMKVCYIALLDIYAQMEKELGPKGGTYQVNYAISEMKKLVGAYYEEAKWFHDGSPPNFEEYMKNAIASSGYMMVATSSLVGMSEDFATKEVFDWVTNEPLMVRASAIIARLMNDIAGHKVEQQRGDVDSTVECYMKQYGKSEEETVKELQEQITNAWKDIKQECLEPNFVPMPILIQIANLARVIDLLYKNGDIYTHSTTELKVIITSLLIDPVV
nr:probable terpene synthase 2 isoform X5 [Ipomoea trifida]